MTNFVIFPRYEDLYEGEVPELNKLLAGIPTCITVGFACHINSCKHHNHFDFKIDLDIFRHMIGRLPKEKAAYLEGRLKAMHIDVTSNDHVVTIFPLPQILQLIEYSIINYQDGPFENITPEQEENLLKAVLVLNTKAEIKSIPKDLSQRKEDPLDNFNSITWPFMLSTIEHTTRKEIVLLMFKSYKLLDFFQSDKYFKPFLDSFLRKNGLNTTSDYLKNLISLILFSFDKEQQHYHSNFKEEDLKNLPLLSLYIRNIGGSTGKLFSEEEKSLKLLREKPILKINGGSNKCFISNWNFIIDKLYEGLKHDFFKQSGIKDDLKGDEKQKWNTFTSKLGQNFNEKVIFKDMVSRYLERNGAVCYFEDNSKGWNQDLYHRKDNHISFIEFKGVSLPLNDTYDTIKMDVDNRMTISVNEKKEIQKKAIYQLIDQIKGFHENINKYENLESIGYPRERLLIYPVIVFTDILWRLPGVDDYLIRLFQEKISKLELKFFSVEELALIPLDYFYTHEKIFIKKQISLHQLIYNTRQVRDCYRQNIRKTAIPPTQHIVDSHADFEFYANQAFRDNYVLPHEMTLFNELLGKLDLPKESL